MKQQIEQAIARCVVDMVAEEQTAPSVRLSRPKQQAHGDFACNIAMQLARTLRQPPAAIAGQIIERCAWPAAVRKVEVAGPGFINIFLADTAEAGVLATIVRQGADYGRLPVDPARPRVMVEYVSANPTGPMHVGHCRGACVGDALASLLAARGHPVTREYYINDAGAQIEVLARSVWLRMRELQGEAISLPEDAYPGDYVIEIAREILQRHPFAELAAMEEGARLELLGGQAVAANMARIRDDLAALGVRFDHYFSERQLHQSGAIRKLIEELTERGLVYRGTLPPPKGKEVADYRPVEQLLFRTTDFGDTIDRPLCKQDGSATYFAADIAYHHDKFQRGFTRQIDVWGADHGGYVARVQAAVKAVCGLDGQPEVVLVQMVNLLRDGKPVKMSKRAGTFVTLREVVDEVGADAVRFNFLTRRAESQLDFDLELARRQSEENPVYYVQYAHARAAAILRKAEEAGITSDDAADTAPLTGSEERRLIAMLTEYPTVLEQAAERREPYRVATWLMELAAVWHRFYHKQRVVVEEQATAQARLLLVRATAQVLRNGLELLGVAAPERM
ncbi:MAG: arginine--tRNA ligase [Zetaproteobacteria bacterium]|nr:MAG: arginine--tRNA ligase [Zetaproteobacteria bacterium]